MREIVQTTWSELEYVITVMRSVWLHLIGCCGVGSTEAAMMSDQVVWSLSQWGIWQRSMSQTVGRVGW